MAGETFSCWSTQVNKDALFVTAILLLSIARLSERLVQTIPKRRTRPNFSLPSIFLQLTLRSKYTYAFEKKKTCNTFERVIDYRLRINRNEGFDIFWSMTVKKPIKVVLTTEESILWSPLRRNVITKNRIISINFPLSYALRIIDT